MRQRRIRQRLRKSVALFTALWLVLLHPGLVLANESSGNADTTVATDAAGDQTGAPDDTGAPACTGNGCGQGSNQGAGQGTNNGGPSIEDLGGTQDSDGDWVLPSGVADTRQGAGQGIGNDGGVTITAENSDTGAGSSNTATSDIDASDTTTIDNEVVDLTDAEVVGNTGGNTHNKNTNSGGTTTGNANIGVTQVKNDNTATIGGTAGLNVDGYEGDYTGDFEVGFGTGDGYLTGEDGGSIRAVNDGTGYDSDNVIDLDTYTEEINEVQNDGVIDNILDLAAITGQNEASMNTGSGSIATGDANVAATLVNLLNTTVINGDLWVTVADIFGDLHGNIVLPDFSELAAANGRTTTEVVATNETTGADSENDIDIELIEEEMFDVDNEAEVALVVNADAITGQNETEANTGGGSIKTGDGSVSASNLTVANTTVEGGNWGLVVVNALNTWMGFMVGDAGDVIALSQDETIREIEAYNSETGAESENEIDIEVEDVRETTVDNDAVINNEVTAEAITGQNEASLNTGAGDIETGDASVGVTAVNIANTTVKDGSLFIAVVNVFGDFLGDLLYDDTSLAATAARGDAVQVSGGNETTGAESENEIDVSVDKSRETDIDNDAEVTTELNTNIDTGNNIANRNTRGAEIETGDGFLALHSRTVANLVGLVLDPATGLVVEGMNGTTGFDSENTINAELNEERVVNVNNDANVSTIFAGIANTGDNEASMNTIGGDIHTGDLDADLSIEALVNKVMFAFANGEGFTVAAGEEIGIDAELLNQLTGALSDNANDVDAVYDFLTNITNDAIIDNLIDLLFNTGGNESNYNTFNQASLKEESAAPLAALPPAVGGGVIEEDDKGSSGGGGGDSRGTTAGSSDESRSSSAVHNRPMPKDEPVGQVLRRFPVAGDLGSAFWMQGERRANIWPVFMVFSLVLVGVAAHYDQQGRRRRELLPVWLTAVHCIDTTS